MTKEEAARILDPDTGIAAMCEIEYYAGFRGPEAIAVAGVDALRIAVEALRHKPTGEPLTPEQLRKMDGQPVWVEFEDRSGGLWGIVHISVFEQIVFPDGLHCTIGQPYYGKIYKAYAYPPAHIDVEAWTAEWTNNGNRYICSSCKVRCAEDSDETDYYPLLSKFCPHCGKAMTPEARAELEKRLRGVRE